MDKVPNPGSDEAIVLGCLCPSMDNHRGRGFPWRNEDGEVVASFWISAKCPLHASGKTERRRHAPD